MPLYALSELIFLFLVYIACVMQASKQEDESNDQTESPEEPPVVTQEYDPETQTVRQPTEEDLIVEVDSAEFDVADFLARMHEHQVGPNCKVYIAFNGTLMLLCGTYYNGDKYFVSVKEVVGWDGDSQNQAT